MNHPLIIVSVLLCVYVCPSLKSITWQRQRSEDCPRGLDVEALLIKLVFCKGMSGFM